MTEFVTKVSSPAERSLLTVLGPGILYAAAAVGVSHLVQATRAGAYYGLGLGVVILIACILKYPSLRFGGDYAAATGRSLIASYREAGWWAFGVYAIAQLFSMVFVVGAIALFTLGLLQASLGFGVHPILGVSILLIAVVTLLLSGQYHLLEKLTKYIVAIFTVLILIAVTLVATKMSWSLELFALPTMAPATILFVVALLGFMPTPPDGSVLQSLWTCARAKDTGQLPTAKDAQLDFNVGYITSVALAFCFLVLGAGVMHSAGVEIDPSNSGFSRQLLTLFTETIGGWSFPLIAVAAVFVMLSTLFTVVDGYTRVAVGVIESAIPAHPICGNLEKLYSRVVVVLCLIAVLVLLGLLKNFAAFMDTTAIIVFVISPILAYLNHRAMWSDAIAAESRPSNFMKWWSLIGIAALSLVTLVYFYVRLS